MPSAKRFAFLRETRAEPSGGRWRAPRPPPAFCWAGSSPCNCSRTPPQPQAPTARTAPQAAVETKAAPKPAPAETTGSAPAGESVASADCEQQTWPHLSRACMEEYRSKNAPRAWSRRTSSTSRRSAPSKPPPPADEAQARGAGRCGSGRRDSARRRPLRSPIATVAVPPQARQPAAGRCCAPAPPSRRAADQDRSVPQAPERAVASPAAPRRRSRKRASRHPQPQSNNRGEQEKRAAKKAKRKPKPTIPDVRRNGRLIDDGASSPSPSAMTTIVVADGRADRSRRIVERWTERDYDVPDARAADSAASP